MAVRKIYDENEAVALIVFAELCATHFVGRKLADGHQRDRRIDGRTERKSIVLPFSR